MADCLARVRRQDQDAARSLVNQLYPTVIKIVRRHLPRRGSEEDLVQDIFVKAFLNLDQYKGVVPFEHWIARIASNHCFNAIRMQKARPEWRMADLSDEQASLLEAVTTSTAAAPDPVLAMEARELVEKLLTFLSPEDQALIRLVEIEELSIAEVTQMTGWSATLIRVRLFRARHKLNKQFGKLRKAGNL